MSNDFPQLRLPKRFEDLEREISKMDSDISQIVQKVDTAAARIEKLIRQVRDGGLGRFELFLGTSGSGKTTFFRTLNMFTEGADVREVPKNLPLNEIASHIRGSFVNTNTKALVWVLYDRDNLQVLEEEAKDFFESLRVLFREVAGKVVIVWPITDIPMANLLATSAWQIGRDSVVDVISKGIFNFQGVPKDKYPLIAELTTRNFSPGQSLETFGLTTDIVNPLVSASETISEFYSRLEDKSAEINGLYQDILKDRVIPKVWILVAGDNNKDLNLTVAHLTQGTEKQIDIDRILAFLDNPGKDAAYLKAWQDRRQQIAFVMRKFDVRLFELPPNAALAAIRVFGDEAAKAPLNLKNTNKATAIDTLSKTAFIRLLLGEDMARNATLTPTDPQTASEYKRIQAISNSNDKRFNKALSELIIAVLASKNIHADVSSEKQAPNSNLKPDILVTMADGSVVCLEPTWRTTGEEIPGELEAKQNTLSVGHIQKYLLEKVLEYVKDLGL